METVVSTLVGGALAVIGVLVGAYVGRRSERQRWRRDLQVQLSREALSALQQLIRVTTDLAYAGLPPRGSDCVDTPDQHELRARLERALTAWNAAMYAMLVGGDEALGKGLRDLDREADRLMEAAMSQNWDRDSFREQRRPTGEAMARYIDLVRARADLPPLGLTTVWTWDVSSPE